MKKFLDCLYQHEPILMREFGYAENLKVRAIQIAEVPSAIRPLVGEVDDQDALLKVAIGGDGVLFICVFIIRSDAQTGSRVRVVLTDAEFPE